MKMMKKLFAFLLALAMSMGMTANAFAANASMTGHSFEAYQIFAAGSIIANQDGSNGTLGNITWGDGITEEGQAALLARYGASDAKDLARKITSENAKEFAQEAYKYVAEGKGKGITNGQTKLPLGYYLIVDTTEVADGTEDFVYNLSILEVANTNEAITIRSKVEVPTVEKKILEGNERVDVNEATIGEAVQYEITANLPENINEFETYFLQFTDTLSAGLTFNNDVRVYLVNGQTEQDITKYFYKAAAQTYSTNIVVSIKDLLALENVKENGAAVYSITGSTNVVVRYSATLNDNAVIAGEGNPNEVELKYSNNPDNSGIPGDSPEENPPEPPKPNHPTGETPKDEVVTYTTEITITKKDEDLNILTGAGFTIKSADGETIKVVTEEKFVADINGNYWKLTSGKYTTDDPQNHDPAAYESTTQKYSRKVIVKTTSEQNPVSAEAMVAADGTVTFKGLGAGKYTITETTTPDGYNTIDPITFTLTFGDVEEDGKVMKNRFQSDNPQIVVGEDNKLDATIINYAGTILPETGGRGTTLFYIVGAAMVAIAGILLLAKRRMRNN